MSEWTEEVRRRLNEMDRSTAQMARALYYSEEYIRNVLREGNPTPRVKNAIEVYVGMKERRT